MERLHLFGLDQAVALEAEEVLPSGHGSDGQGTGRLFDSGAAGALEEFEYLMLCRLHKGEKTRALTFHHRRMGVYKERFSTYLMNLFRYFT